MNSAHTGPLRGEHPDHPGWRDYVVGQERHFNRAMFGTMLVRLDVDKLARVRVFPREMHTNLYGSVHGGVVLALTDIALFAGCSILRGEDLSGAVTLQLDSQFTGASDPAQPLDALVEIVRETGKLIFCRGSIVQGDSIVSAFSGILRKVTPR
jgi:acyl-coenzyme A thioesterase PaaI-like protein